MFVAENLVDAIRANLPHASTDNMLPILGGVRLDSGVAYATDRYTIGRVEYATGEGSNVPEEHDVFVPVATAKLILAAKSPAVSLEVDQVPVLTLANGQTFTLQNMSDVGNYPAVERLFFGDDTEGELGRVSFQQKNLDKFTGKHFPHQSAAGRKVHAPVFEFQNEPTKPVRVTFTEFPWFTGLIVPLRVNR